MSGKKSQPEELTRREWLLRLGGITALAGVAGLAPPAATALLGAEDNVATLPPGLYQPSPRHLIHALSAQGGLAIPPGSETDYAPPLAAPFRPRFFSGEEFPVVTRVLHVVLGGVDKGALAETAAWLDLRLAGAAGVRQAARRLDPLHRALAVAYYGEAQVVELETADPQSVARAGLAALQQQARDLTGKDFLRAGEEEQAKLVREMSQAAPDSALRRLYDLLRREAIRGYYTSRAGLKELDYKGNTYHSQCPGCERT